MAGTMIGQTAWAQAQTSWGELYFTDEELPNAAAWLPAPPDTLGPHFAYDIMKYMWGKTVRDTERQDSLLKLGYEWGQSRVIVGYHWQSDVDASYLMAAGVFARLHTSPLYMADLAAAREEFQRLKAKELEMSR